MHNTMNNAIRHSYAFATALAVTTARRLRDDRGEGVISTGIAVLIIALLGAAAFVIFRGILTDAGDRARVGVGGVGN